MDLYLVRHAIAEDRDAQRWPDDAERPLTSAGISKFQSAARGLGRLVSRVDAVWSSPFRRAWQTAEILQQEAGWPAPTAFAPLAAGRAVDRLLRELASEARYERLVLVGHAPDLDELAALAVLGTTQRVLFALKKGGAACLRFEPTPRAGAAVLEWVATPKLLRGPGR